MPTMRLLSETLLALLTACVVCAGLVGGLHYADELLADNGHGGGPPLAHRTHETSDDFGYDENRRRYS